jgi:MoaA/NifB/PqqE/SkfB family radical SAM enzyme
MEAITQHKITDQKINFPPQQTTIVRSKVKLFMLKLRLFYGYLKMASEALGSWRKGYLAFFELKRRVKAYFNTPFLSKVAQVDGRYFYRLGVPGFPSDAWTILMRNELNRVTPFQDGNGVRSLVFAITKKCPLNCEHCYEWNNLNKPDTLSLEDLQSIVKKYQQYGTTQIIFSGGEPMLRYDDILEVLKQADTGTDFWIVTSGLGLTLEKARALKAAELSGVIVSLDHHQPERHNAFRGYRNAYNNVITAVTAANAVKLTTALSLCLRRDYPSKLEFDTYMQLAKMLGVSFVQIFEPYRAGRFEGKDVGLSQEQITMISEAYQRYNTSKAYADFPIINYLIDIQRKYGCFGGDRFFYIDTDGDAHVCPVCQSKICSALTFSPADTKRLLSQYSCHNYDILAI